MIQYIAQCSIELDNVHQQTNILCSVLLLHANVHIIAGKPIKAADWG